MRHHPENAYSRVFLKRKYNQGQILAELILAIAIVAIIGVIIAELTVTSTRLAGNSSAGLAKLRLAEEALEALRAISQGNDSSSQGWNRIYLPPDGTGDPELSKGAAHPYHLGQSGNMWTLLAGEESLTLSDTDYQRKIIIENVSRDPLTGAIEAVYNLINKDPATQKITVTVAAPTSLPVTLTAFVSRYLNEGSRQTGWNGGIQTGPFPATSSVDTISSSQNTDLGNGACGISGPCIRLQPQ